MEFSIGDKVRINWDNIDLDYFSPHVAGLIILARDKVMTVTSHCEISEFTYYVLDKIEEAFLANELKAVKDD